MIMRIFQNMLSVAAFCLVIAGVSTVYAQEYTSLREVMQDEILRRDFALQGEYLYEADGTKMGLHLIADGDGKFRCVFYDGGLPGAGWNTGDFRMLGTATVDGEDGLKFVINKAVPQDKALHESLVLPLETKATFSMATARGPMPGGGTPPGDRAVRPQGDRPQNANTPRPGAPIAGRVAIEMKLHGKDTTFAKTMRRSETLGAEAPEGAVVIFDGTNVDMFAPGAKINEATLPGQGPGQAGNRPQGQGPRPGFGNTLWAEAIAKPFEQKPYTLHLEFMLSYMPTSHGQARSNSGVYIYEAYECQVLDSFGLELANNECGGFYQVSAPSINMCLPPLTWQTYDFDFTPPKYDGDKKVENARITVKHNGVVIHDNIELPKETPGCKREANEPRGVYLQGHGNKVQYRNIWLQYKD